MSKRRYLLVALAVLSTATIIACGGGGQFKQAVMCRTCGGSGKCKPCGGGGGFFGMCGACNGSGKCRDCAGNGW